MDSLTGQLLISGGGLWDPNFRHTVVLLGAHNEEGALGVVLNRPADLSVAQVFPPLAEVLAADARLYKGGPVQPTQPVLLADLADPSLADVHVFGHIGFLTGDVAETTRPSIRRARVFAGYAGWGAGQLEDELEADSWILEPAREEDVFDDEPASLWKRILQRKGPEFRQVSMMPFDPRVN